MRTISTRDWLIEIGLQGEIISGGEQCDRLSVKGQEYIRRPVIMQNVVRANNYRVRRGEYIYLAPSGKYHSVTLKT